MEPEVEEHGLTRRQFIETATAVSGATAGATLLEAETPSRPATVPCIITVNGAKHDLSLDARTTLLDLLREQLHLTGTKKGCDHGQCGACTILVDGQRVLSCLTLAATGDDRNIMTIEGITPSAGLHPMQAAFLESDGFQCGFCTPGQICSAIAMLAEVRSGVPSAVTRDLANSDPVNLTSDEVRERMSGNICRCGAYPNIVDAILTTYRS
jgi:xanthine dehydrogenase YagT iron-sulfur-binding subunit